jgi:[NiFe] hydrogenase diaphorase moiety large subunit
MDKQERKGPVIFSAYEKLFALKKALSMNREDILLEIKESKLKGRGGAGFPTSTKWMLVAAAKSDKKFVICNADEGEPGTFKDRVLLLEYPELVIEGMIIAAYTIKSDQGFIYLRGEYEYMLKNLNDYLEELRKMNVLGKDILGKKSFDFDITIRLGSGAYVCGEETALIESLEGHRGESRNRPPFPVSKGYKGKPTTVNNVETFAAVTRIIEKGGKWFQKYGTSISTGSKLFSISGDCKKPGVYELPWGKTINEILKLVEAENTKAVQIGGASGKCYNSSQFDKKISYEDCATGGSIIIFNKNRNMIDVLENFMEFFTEESCGQCTPCRIGNRKLLEGIRMIKNNEYTFDYINKLKDLSITMQVASKCGLGQSSPNSFISILENFSNEVFNNRLVEANHE